MVEEGEDGGVGADAEGESEDSDGREAGSTAEGAERVSQVTPSGIE